MIYLQLLLSFIQVGLFSVGGGYAAMPLIQAQVVDQHAWLSLSEFTDLVTIAEMTPGPIAINAATFVGTRLAGPLGAIVATLGCILPSLIVVSIMSYIYARFSASGGMQSVLSCLRPTVVALIASAALSILTVVVFAGGIMNFASINWIGLLLFAGALLLLRLKRLNPILVMAMCGAANVILTAVGLC